MTTSKPLVVLDVDDTLYLERDYVRSGFNAVGEHLEREYGVEGFATEAWTLFNDGVRGNTFDRALERLDFRGADVEELVEVYRHHKPGISLLPDAQAFIQAVSGHVHLAVVTDGPVISQRNKIEALGLEKWISKFVVTSERGAEWHKPAPLAFRHLQEQFRKNHDQCVYVADNPTKDFEGPLALGWGALRINRPGALHEQLVDPLGVASIRTLIDLVEWFVNGLEAADPEVATSMPTFIDREAKDTAEEVTFK